MQIMEISDFKVKRRNKSDNIKPKIILENSKIEKSIELTGFILEKQYKFKDNYLLFITEGTPEEEDLYIYFLDKNMRIQDLLEVSAEYTAGILKNISYSQLNKITFSFFDEEDWMLEIFNKPRFLLPFRVYPIKRHFTILKKSWFKLRKIKHS